MTRPIKNVELSTILAEHNARMSVENPEYFEEMINDLLAKLNCPRMAADLENLLEARDRLATLQHKELFERILGPESRAADRYKIEPLKSSKHHELTKSDDYADDTGGAHEEMGEEETCPHLKEPDVEKPEDAWHGYFKGYSILTEENEFHISENKKCVEITKHNCDESLEEFLRSGICCYVIDLFTGTETENQQLIVRLRESELKVSTEIGFPVTSTLFAKLSPRLQYTGELEPMLQSRQFEYEKNMDRQRRFEIEQLPELELKLSPCWLAKGEEFTLTTSRAYAAHSNRRHIYVNARFLLVDVKQCDIICIGPDIQVQVRVIDLERMHMRCRVIEAGLLQSRLPVLFPARCQKFRISMEELEDITFAKEVGINVLVSHLLGTPEYYAALCGVLRLLGCDKLRLGARVILNELRGCEQDFNWAADAYEGFVVELTAPQPYAEPELLHLCPAAEKFLQRVFDLKKPIVLDATPLAEKQLVVEPAHYPHIYYYPDKYLFRCADMRHSFYFFHLQGALYEPLSEQALSQLPYCDASHTGSDSMARSICAAVHEMHASAIVVLGVTGRMVIKLAHFRPKVPIIFVTHMKSAAHYIGIYHSVFMLRYRSARGSREEREQDNPHQTMEMHTRVVYKKLLFGLLYGKTRKLIKHMDNVVLVYGQQPGITLPGKYVTYKFHEWYFSQHLNKILSGPD